MPDIIPLEELIESSVYWTDEEIFALFKSKTVSFAACCFCKELLIGQWRTYCSRKCQSEGGLDTSVESRRQARKLWWDSLDDVAKHRIQKAASLALSKLRWSGLDAEQNKQPIVAAENRKFWKGFSTGRQGFRPDIGISVRSRWEANYARFLNYLLEGGNISRWEYEPTRFEFPDIKRGTRSYLPDFRITNNDGSVEYHEVKGYWTSKAKTAVKRFRTRFPELTLLIVERAEYANIEKRFGDLIPEWER